MNRVLLVLFALSCRKETAAPPPEPKLKLIDAAIDAPADAAIDAPIDAPADAATDAPVDARAGCKPNECYFREQKKCVVPTGQRGNALCGEPGGFCNVCRCAAPWTPIDTPEGPRAIADLRVGDRVFSLDGDRVVIVAIERTNRVAVTAHSATELVFDDDTQLLISSEHPLADGRELGALTAGEALGPRRVVSARVVDYPHDATYDILPASPSRVYFSNGVPLGSTLR